jgi:hypothetical protein
MADMLWFLFGLIYFPQISQISQIKEKKRKLLLARHGLNCSAKILRFREVFSQDFCSEHQPAPIQNCS